MPKSNKFHCNLTSKNFPFSCDELSSTVFINQGREQQRQLLQGFDGKDVVDSFGICQTWFMSNVLPITRGFSSVYYTRKLEALQDSLTLSEGQVPDQAIMIKEGYDSVALLVPCFGGAAIYDPELAGWASYAVSGYNSGKVTATYLKGKTYVCFSGIGIFSYDFSAKSFDAVDFVALEASGMRGVASSLSYLLTWDDQYIYWGSAYTPTDFTPSLSQGAGSSKLLAQKGAITCVLPIADGFIVYTTTQAIAATYSGNAVDPWIFREIPNSAGVEQAEHVAYGSASDSHIAWTSSGFQTVTMREAEQLWPELSDSIAREVFTGFNANRTFDKGQFPIHQNFASMVQTPNAGEVSNIGPYPFHLTDLGEPGFTATAVGQEAHHNILTQAELTRVTVPTSITWKGPFRLKVSSIGSRFVAVSVGVESDNEIILTDTGMVDGEAGWIDSFDGVTGDPITDDTPAGFVITDVAGDDAIGTSSKKYYDFAYVYDIALNRWGRLDCEHADLFEFSAPLFTAQATYQDFLDAETALATPYTYQQLTLETTALEMVTDGTTVLGVPDLNGVQYIDPIGEFGVSDVNYLSFGASGDLTPARFGDNFGVLSKTGGVFVARLFDGKYQQEVLNVAGYDAATTLMKQTDDSELGLNTLPHLIHGRYKVSRGSGALLHGVNFSKIVANGLVSVWALPHADDGSCLAPVPLTNIQTWQQDKVSVDQNTTPTVNQAGGYDLRMQKFMGEHGRFAGRVAGDSVSVMLAGHFTLSDLTIDIEPFGTRNFASNVLDPDNTYWWYIREFIEEIVP